MNKINPMILTCPACQTQYIVPEDALKNKDGQIRARTVKCAACSFSWKQAPITVTEIDLTAPLQFEETLGGRYLEEDAAMMAQNMRWQQALQADIAATVGKPLSLPGFAGQAAGWLALFALVTGISLIYLRDDLARWWPQSTLFYEAIGFPAPIAGQGLAFQDDVNAQIVPNSVPPRLHVSGRFQNTLPHAVPLPVLQARLFNAQGEWLKDWSIPLQNVQNIAGHGMMGFDYTLPQVPLEASRLTFRFVDG